MSVCVCVTHPVRYVCTSFLGCELHDTAMCVAVDAALVVGNAEHHGVLNASTHCKEEEEEEVH